MSWIGFKIWIKLKFVYPRTEKFRKIKSVIPADVQIGEGVIIEENVVFNRSMSIGKHTFIGKRTEFYNCSKIGNFTSISSDVKVGLISHPLNYISTSPVFYSKRRGWVKGNSFSESKDLSVEIGCDVLISTGVMMLPGIKIGHGAVIGAGAFVNKDIPPYAIVAGVPAKIIRYRFTEEIIKQLLSSKWWERDDLFLKEIAVLSNEPEKFISKLK